MQKINSFEIICTKKSKWPDISTPSQSIPEAKFVATQNFCILLIENSIMYVPFNAVLYNRMAIITMQHNNISAYGGL